MSDRLRFRVYVDGDLADEQWLTTGEPERVDATARYQGELCGRAREAGRDWLLEVYDPDRPEADPDAYLRIGPGSPVEAGAVVEAFALVVDLGARVGLVVPRWPD